MNVAMFQELFRSAQHGDASGYCQLTVDALAAGRSGELADTIALTHGVIWARLATSVDPSATNLTTLSEILASYAQSAWQRGFATQAVQMGAQAIYRMEQAAKMGFESAAERLERIARDLPSESASLAAEWERNDHHGVVEEDDCLRAAACGEPAAINEMFDAAVAFTAEDGMDTIDGIAFLDIIGALGLATGDDGLAIRQAGVLLTRASYLRAFYGANSEHWRPSAEALDILAGLVGRGVHRAANALNVAVELADPRALVAVAQDTPSILAALECKGIC